MDNSNSRHENMLTIQSSQRRNQGSTIETRNRTIESIVHWAPVGQIRTTSLLCVTTTSMGVLDVLHTASAWLGAAT